MERLIGEGVAAQVRILPKKPCSTWNIIACSRKGAYPPCLGANAGFLPQINAAIMEDDMSKDAKRLGRGIASIISTPSPDETKVHGLPPSPIAPPVGPAGHQRLAMVPLSSIRPNPAQPRRDFDEEALQGLAESIKRRGTLQPIAVRPAEGGFELIAGERRLRAAQMAGLESIPAVVRPVKDDDLLELALIENIQREDLNPVERALAYRNLNTRHNLSHEEIGARMGEDRATVSNYIRLLDLIPEVLQLVSSGELPMGHARALLGISDKKDQLSIARKIVGQGWSVRQTEAAIKKATEDVVKSPAKEVKTRPAVADMERRLTDALGTRVSIKEGRRRHTGKITIEYFSLDDFDRVTGRLGVERDTA